VSISRRCNLQMVTRDSAARLTWPKCIWLESAWNVRFSLVRLSADDVLQSQRGNPLLFSTFSHIRLLGLLPPVLNITMSFGFSVGDFVAVLQLANTIRERFVGAPEQFKAISNE
jgi:hypothetical protein